MKHSSLIPDPLNHNDQELINKTGPIIDKFINSDEKMLELDPMNGYQRRLIHKLASAYHLESKSVGNDDERFVCLVKTEKTAMPAPRNNSSRSRNNGNGNSNSNYTHDQSYFAYPNTKIILRSDGSVGVPTRDERLPTIDERTVDGEFKIIKSKIICPSDEAWT